MSWKCILFGSNHSNKSVKVADFGLVFLGETGYVLLWNYECEMRVLHLMELILGNTLLQREEVFDIYTVGFGEHLTPAVFARCLCS